MTFLEMIATTLDRTIVVHEMIARTFYLHLDCFLDARSDGRVLPYGDIRTLDLDDLVGVHTCACCEKPLI